MCKPFVELGWCEKGDECKLRHSVECPEFAETGTCSRKGCRLPHVVRRRNVQEEEEDEEGDSDDTREGEIDYDAPPATFDGNSKRRRRDDDDDAVEGISGSAGIKLSNKKKARRAAQDLEGNSDFVTLSIPLDDEDQDEDAENDDDSDEEGSVDSADLHDDEEPQDFDDLGSLAGDPDFLMGEFMAAGVLGFGDASSDDDATAAAPVASTSKARPSAPSSDYQDAPMAPTDDDEASGSEDDGDVERLLRY